MSAVVMFETAVSVEKTYGRNPVRCVVDAITARRMVRELEERFHLECRDRSAGFLYMGVYVEVSPRKDRFHIEFFH